MHTRMLLGCKQQYNVFNLCAALFIYICEYLLKTPFENLEKAVTKTSTRPTTNSNSTNNYRAKSTLYKKFNTT